MLTDGGTASAAEEFAALLRDNDAALIVGAPTYGAGCGYTAGGITLRLEHSGLEIRAPDCVRLRRDGSNEVFGITPDLDAGWSDGDDAAARGEKLRHALAGAS